MDDRIKKAHRIVEELAKVFESMQPLVDFGTSYDQRIPDELCVLALGESKLEVGHLRGLEHGRGRLYALTEDILRSSALAPLSTDEPSEQQDGISEDGQQGERRARAERDDALAAASSAAEQRDDALAAVSSAAEQLDVALAEQARLSDLVHETERARLALVDVLAELEARTGESVATALASERENQLELEDLKQDGKLLTEELERTLKEQERLTTALEQAFSEQERLTDELEQARETPLQSAEALKVVLAEKERFSDELGHARAETLRLSQELTGKLAAQKVENTRLQEQANAARSTHSRIVEKLDIERSESFRLSEHVAVLGDQLAVVEAERVAFAQGASDAASADLFESRERVALLTQERDAQQAERWAEQEELNRLQGKLVDVQARVEREQKSTIARAEETAAEKRVLVEELQQIRARLLELATESEEKLAKAQAEIERFAEEIRSKNVQVQQVTAEVADGLALRKSEERAAHASISEVVDARDVLANELESVKAELAALQADTETETADIHTSLAATEAERNALTAKLEETRLELAERLEEAVSEWEAVSTLLEETTAERDALTGERDGAVAERDALVGERDGAVAERDALVGERDGAVAERDVTGERLEEETSARRALMDEKRVLMEKVEALEHASRESDSTEAETAALKSALNTAVEEMEAMHERLEESSLREELISEELSLMQSEIERGKRTQEAGESSEGTSALRQEVSVLTMRNEAILAERAGLRVKLEESYATQKRLTEDLTRLHATEGSGPRRGAVDDAEMEALRQARDALSDKLEERAAERWLLSEDLTQAQADRDTAKTALEHASAREGGLRGEVKRAKEEAERLQRENATLMSKVAGLEQSSQKVDARGLRTRVGESVPPPPSQKASSRVTHSKRTLAAQNKADARATKPIIGSEQSQKTVVTRGVHANGISGVDGLLGKAPAGRILRRPRRELGNGGARKETRRGSEAKDLKVLSAKHESSRPHPQSTTRTETHRSYAGTSR